MNKPYAVCGIATDITALKRTEELQIWRARQAALHGDIHVAFSGGTESAFPGDEVAEDEDFTTEA
jgi:hypothetical protein